MLLRGRITLGAVAAALGLLVWGVVGDGDADAAHGPAAHETLPPVAAFGPDTHEDAPPPVDPVEPELPAPAPPPAPEVRAPTPAPAKEAKDASRVPDEILARIPVPLPRSGRRDLPQLVAGEAASPDVRASRARETVALAAARGGATGPLEVEYTIDAGLTEAIYDVFERGRVQLGLAVVLDPQTGDVLAYAGTDPRRLPPSETYPGASLVKVVTAAAALERAPGLPDRICRYVGNPYRLTPARVSPPKRGNDTTFERALAISNNQCFAQLAVNDVGAIALLDIFRRFGLLQRPAPGHESGQAEDPHGDRYELGKLGCGLAGLQITALHAAEIAATLADGKRREPRWIARVRDARGRELSLPSRPEPVQVLRPALADQLREMMTATTTSGTARRAFRGAYGRPVLRAMTVAAKTGSLSGKTPPGRYEWFIALAPAEHPKVAIAVLVVQSKRWHTTGSQVGAQVLNAVFCTRGVCRPDRADQWLAAGAADTRLARAR
jgi:membrane peptidoglycan carboxypeptidase